MLVPHFPKHSGQQWGLGMGRNNSFHQNNWVIKFSADAKTINGMYELSIPSQPANQLASLSQFWSEPRMNVECITHSTRTLCFRGSARRKHNYRPPLSFMIIIHGRNSWCAGTNGRPNGCSTFYVLWERVESPNRLYYMCVKRKFFIPKFQPTVLLMWVGVK